jgi:hypothetical protein
MLKKQIILLLLLLFATLAAAVPMEQGIYSSEYYLSIYPYYPPH